MSDANGSGFLFFFFFFLVGGHSLQPFFDKNDTLESHQPREKAKSTWNDEKKREKRACELEINTNSNLHKIFIGVSGWCVIVCVFGLMFERSSVRGSDEDAWCIRYCTIFYVNPYTHTRATLERQRRNTWEKTLLESCIECHEETYESKQRRNEHEHWTVQIVRCEDALSMRSHIRSRVCGRAARTVCIRQLNGVHTINKTESNACRHSQ